MELLQPLRKMPFLRILMPYLTGLVTGYFCFPAQHIRILLPAFVVLAVPLICMATGKPLRYNYTWIFGMLLTLLLFIMGAGNVLSRKYAKDRFDINASDYQTGRLVIMDTPEILTGSVRAVAKIRHLNSHQQKHWLKTKVMLSFPPDIRSETLAPGDIILLRARFLPVRGAMNPGEFDYKSYLLRQDIDYQVFVQRNAWKVVGRTSASLKILALRCRNKILDCFRTSGMDQRTVAVLSALTMGYKSDLGSETTAWFTRAGVVHVMALSGFNVGLIFLMVNFCLGFMRNPRSLVLFRLLASLAAIWAFAVITGLSASVTRASVMLSLFLTAKFISRDVHPLNVLSASAFLMLVFSPFSFLDVGFQLSFAAVLGLIYIQPYLYRLMTLKYWLPDKVWMLFTVSVAAQVATTPLTLYYFHQVPLLFWITNLYVVPLVSLIIYLSVPFVLLSFIEPVRAILARILEFMTDTLLFPLEKLGDFQGLLADGIFIGRFQVLLLFILLIAAGGYINHKKAVFGLASATVLLVLLITNGLRLYSINRQHYLTVNSISKASVMNIIAGRDNSLIAFSEKPLQEKILPYSFRNWWIKCGVYGKPEIIPASRLQSVPKDRFVVRDDILGRNMFFCFSGTRFVVCNEDMPERCAPHPKIRLDYVIITEHIKPDIKKLQDHFEFSTLIIDSSVGFHASRQWSVLCRLNDIDCWPVGEKGAFVLALR